MTINFGLVLTAIMKVLFRCSENYTARLAICFVGDLGLGLYWVPTKAWLANIVSDNRRTRGMAIYATAISVGFAAGPGIICIVGFFTMAPFYLITAFLPLSA